MRDLKHFGTELHFVAFVVGNKSLAGLVVQVSREQEAEASICQTKHDRMPVDRVTHREGAAAGLVQHRQRRLVLHLVGDRSEHVDRDVLEKTWENLLSESVLPKKQYPSLEGINTILNAELKGKAANPEDFADSSFIRELDKSGYIDALYKK